MAAVWSGWGGAGPTKVGGIGPASTLDLSPYRLERFAEGQTLRIAYPQAGVMA